MIEEEARLELRSSAWDCSSPPQSLKDASSSATGLPAHRGTPRLIYWCRQVSTWHCSVARRSAWPGIELTTTGTAGPPPGPISLATMDVPIGLTVPCCHWFGGL